LDDAKVAAAWLHQDISAAEVNAVRCPIAANNQETAIEFATILDRELWEQALENAFAVLRHLGWFAVLGRRGTIGAQVAEVGGGGSGQHFAQGGADRGG
jgi:hypothetical protein